MRRDVFQAIADPVRRDIITLLVDEPRTVNAVAEQFEISRPAVSKHLKILEECGVITITQSGRTRYCQVAPASLLPVSAWVLQHRKLWEDKLDAFEDYLMTLQSKSDNHE